MQVLLLAFMLVASTAALNIKHLDAQRTTINAVSSDHGAFPITFIGKHNGDLLKCNQEDPDKCEVFLQAAESPIYSLLISGEYIYVGLNSGVILRCRLNDKNSCENFYSSGAEVWSLVSARGHLFAGLVDGTILRCGSQRQSCQRLHNVTYSVNSLFEKDDILYAGLASGDIVGCSTNIANNCRDIYEADAGVSGIVSFKDSTYVLTNEGQLLKCSRISGPDAGCVTVDSQIKNESFWDIRVFNESLYVYGDDIGICKWVNDDSCERHIKTSAWRFAFAYATHDLQDERNNDAACKQEEDCYVNYYDELERAPFEVYVSNGKLRYNSNYSLVDTSSADQGHSGPAAIFVMAPDGRIYLSNHHQGSIHTSSFLAGNPVSGAGEIIVEDGVIKKIVACSHHYKPDLELNKQVIQSLQTRGYKDPIVLEACH